MLSEPTRTGKEWRCWLAHVAHIRYCLRRSYPLSAPARLKRLNDDFLDAFAQTKWSEWGKPKWHLPDHFEESLEENGPFRLYWCYSYEAFVQLLKRLFEMGNYSNAPMHVMQFWLCKAILRWRNPRQSAWRECHVECSDDAFRLDWDVYISTSILGEALANKQVQPSSFRLVRAVSRGDDSICLGDRIYVQDRTCHVVGLVDEIVQLIFPNNTQSLVRMWISDARPATIAADDSLEIDATGHALQSMIRFEDTTNICVVRVSTVRSTPSCTVYLV